MSKDLNVPLGTTHIRKLDKKPFVFYYKVTPVIFSDSSKGTRLEYYNTDWGSWQGCVNTYTEVLNLINNKDSSITEYHADQT